MRDATYRLYLKKGTKLDDEAAQELNDAMPILREEGRVLEIEVEATDRPYPEGLAEELPHTWERYIKPGLIAVYSFTGPDYDSDACDPAPWADVMIGELHQGYHYDPCGEVPVLRVSMESNPEEAAKELEKAQAAWREFKRWVEEEAGVWPEALVAN